MKSCPFCNAVAGTGTTPVIYRDPALICILDLNPINPGHILVIPAGHVPSFTDLPDETLNQMMATAKRMAKALRASSLPCDGIDLILTDGRAAGQTVPHCHLHVVPRVEGDGFRFSHGSPPKAMKLEDAAAAIQASLEA
jgi:histidine triad (HIT) family protein